MRLFSSKKICIMIVSAGLLFAAALLGVSAARQLKSRQTFEEEGYILTMEQDEEQIVVNRQNWFSAGDTWNRSGSSSVSFRNEEGDRIVVDNDSFIHYGSSSLAATKEGAISDMDSYLDGIIGSYYLPAGNTLNWNGSSFTIQSENEEQRFENFIWKNSEQRYLLGSPSFTITFSGGDSETSKNGFLELYYLGNDRKIVQFSNGEQAWQVLSRDCLVTFENGVVLDCETGDIYRPSEEPSGTSGTDAAAELKSQVMTLQNIEINAQGSIVLGSTQHVTFVPSFRFTLFDGEDGASGEDGEGGQPGENGEDGEDGEDGQEGTAGTAGAAGENGQDGTGGGTDTTVINGGVDPGIDIKTGQPAIIVPEGGWNMSSGLSHPTFQLAYESESYEAIDPTTDNAYIYLYNVKTGSVIQEWKNQTITDNAQGYVLDNPLEMDTTYGLAVVDTYNLGGTTYTTKLLDRIFTTDTTGVQVLLMDRTKDSFTIGVRGDDYTEVKKVEVSIFGPDGNLVKTEEYDDTTNFQSFVIGTSGTPDLTSNTYYTMELKVSCAADGAETTKEYDLNWTTLKKEPVLGGVELRQENGYLVAKALGAWDGSAGKYADVVDEDRALESVTYSLYDASGLKSDPFGVAKKVETISSLSDVYFKVDGELLKNHSDYYVIADYVWNDGAKSIETPLRESGSGRTGADPAITTSSLGGRAFDYAEALLNSGVNMSFSGSGTELYNLAGTADPTEGTTYETITGSLLVNLSGTKISVSDTRQLRLVITDNQTYEKQLTYNSCDGKQGNIEGSFALPLDVDGLLVDNTYAMTLYGYVYDQSSSACEYQTIGTITIRTDNSADIVMGMQPAANGGTGVDFWLGSTTQAEAITLKNYYDRVSGTYGSYTEAGVWEEDESAYFSNTNASYRNLSSIIFELYAGSSTNPDHGSLLGTCEVYSHDSAGNRASFMPGYSPMYQKYYGEAINGSKDNNVGVGDSFAYRFEYYYETTRKTGIIPETDLPQLSDGKFTVKVRVCYDYTYDRYNYDGPGNLYDYYIANTQLDMEDYINELTINGGAGLILPDLLFQERPVSPNDVTRDGYAVTVSELENRSMGAYNGQTGSNDTFDPALLAETGVGLNVGSYYKDVNRMTRQVTFYGTTYEIWENHWDSEQTLTDVRDAKYTDADSQEHDVFGFKFTFPMTKNGEADGEPREDMPHLYLLMYDSSDAELTSYLTNTSNGYAGPVTGDRGYAYRKYVQALDAWIIYTNTSFLKRGLTYVFAYDAILDFTIDNNGGTFQYPRDYYDHEWIAGKKYAKNTPLRSQYTPFRKQEPQVDMQLLSSESVNLSIIGKSGKDTWNIYLNDPDRALLSDSLMGYSQDYEFTGAIYDANGSAMTDNQSSSFSGVINVGFRTGSTNHSLVYKVDDDSSSIYYNTIYGSLDNQTRDQIGNDDYQTLEDLFTAMRRVEVDTSGNVTSAGTTITVSELLPTGIFYSWKAVYRLIDDYQTQNEQGMIPLAEHAYGGHAEWTLNASGQLTTEEGETYNVVSELDTETNDTVYVELQNSQSSAAYGRAMRRLAAVRITAEKENADHTWSPILERDQNGNTISDQPKEIWKSVSSFSGSNYYSFSFSISAFDQAEDGRAAQFVKGDNLRFTYELYYDTGNRAFTDVSEDSWYALKSVNGYASGVPQYGTLRNAVQTSTLTYNSLAGSSFFRIAGAADKPKVERTSVKSNAGIWYLDSTRQTYAILKAPFSDIVTNAGDKVERSESMRYGADLESGYRIANVAEFCKLGRVTCSWTTEVKPIAPTLADYTFTPGLSQIDVDLNIENYNLMDYPDSEKLHLYYALYEVSTREEYGETITDLSLTGVMIGEADQTSGSRSIRLDQLEQNKTYRLYIYYKDNRDNNADTDVAIFGAGNVPAAGTFVTGNAAVNLAKAFTPLEGNALNPSSNEPKKNIQKIMGYKTVVVTEAGRDEAGNDISAVLDYYEDITTLNGIVIESLNVSLGYNGAYLTNSGSGKTMTCSATTRFKQDDKTRLFFVVERCPLSENRLVEDNWKTVLADENYPTGTENPQFRSWDGAVSSRSVNYHTFQTYGTDYTYTNLSRESETSSSYKASMSLTYYPGTAMAPGYYYRVRAMIFQYDADGNNPKLVSLESTSSSKPYRSTGHYQWKQYKYSELDLPVKVTNIRRSQNSITVNLKATFNGMYLDRRYYLRLWKCNNSGQWEVVEDDGYYGSQNSGGTTWNRMALVENVPYQDVTFQNLESNTAYAIRFYGLTDVDYDNHLNIKENGVPLQGNDGEVLIYNNLADHYSNGTVASNQLTALYQKYLGITSYEQAGNLRLSGPIDPSDQNSPTWATRAANILLESTSEIRTFTANQVGTIGSHYQTDVDAARRSIKLYFENASGLQYAETITYTIKYFGSVENVETVTGQVSKGSAGSPMNNGATDGDVMLTITNDRLELSNKGTYYVQLELRKNDGTSMEKPETITFLVD